jgi:HAMP domain-containing protein
MLSENQFEHYLEKAREGVQDSADETSATLQPAIERAEAAFATYDAFIKTKVLNAEKLEIQTADAYKASREPTATLTELSNAAYVASSAALTKRLSSITAHRASTIAVLAIGFGFALLLLWMISRSMTRPMTQAIAIFHSIEAGMYDNRIESSGSDEASQVLQSLDQLQRKLRTEAAGGSLQASAELRIKSALDRATSRIILADENFKVIYANDAMERFMYEARADLRREMPRLDVDHLIGSSLDGLFKNHVNQRRTLQESPTYATDISIGDRPMRIATNAVVDPEGRRIGTMVELLDRFDRSQGSVAAVVNG